jgi:formylglycine-generating enzyme required for sulfatase activity
MIFTFYSFKGGVGRSMALANVADRLARRGLRVLAIDFDLEAPGLERYYPIDKTAALANPGLIDLLRSFKESLSGRGDTLDSAAFRDLSRFVFPIYERVGEGGRLDLLPAGCRSAGDGLRRYALDVRTFDWQDFYYNWEGEAFFEWLRRELTGPQGRYDAVLVDSRTGVTEMGGVCAYQLADIVVMMSAANHQNLLGTQDVARDFRSAPVMALRHGKSLELLVVPSRIEQRDPALLDAFFARFEQIFEGQMPSGLAGLSSRILAIPYEPEYAFEEVVVTDPARRDRLAGLGAAYERLADALVILGDGAMVPLQAAARAALWPSGAPAAPAQEAAVNYDPTRRFADYDLFVSRSAGDTIVEQLVRVLAEHGLTAFLDSSALVPGDDVSQATTHALHHSRTLLLCAGGGGLSPWQKRQVEQARSAARPVRVLPVLLPGSDPEIFALSLKGMGDVQPVDLREWPARHVEFDLLVSLITAGDAAESPAPSAASASNPYPGLAPGGERHAGCLDLPAQPLDALVDALRRSHNVLLVGASGSGKTTLLAAGLLPAVRKGALGDPAPEVRWIDARQHDGMLGSLGPPAPDAPPQLCIVDHADEEPAALPPHGVDAVARRVRWGQVIRLLSTLPSERWRLVLVTRQNLSEWHGKRVTLDAVDEAALGARLELPALRTGMAFEPGLLKLLQADASRGSEPLTLAQLVLPGLWKGARHGFLGNDAYASEGGVDGAYLGHVSGVLANVPQGLPEAVDSVLLWLLQSNQEAAWSWRRSTLSQMVMLRGWSDTLAMALLWLVRARVLHVSPRDGDLEVGLVGTLAPMSCVAVKWLIDAQGPQVRLRAALAFALDRWQRANRAPDALLGGQGLADAQRLVEEWSDHLTHDMVAFVAASQRAAQVQRTRRRRIAGSVALTLAALAIGGYAYTDQLAKRNEALAQQERAQAQRANATSALLREAQRAAAAVAQVAGNNRRADGLRGARIAIQYGTACESGAVSGLVTALGALGASVDPPQQARTPARGDVRFHDANDRARAQQLQGVVGDLVAAMGLQLQLDLNDREQHVGEPARPGTLEVWLPELSQLPAVAQPEPVRGRDGAELKQVPGSCATLGSEREERQKLMHDIGGRYFSFLDNDRPRARRWIDAFYIHRTEVTNAMFGQYVSEACRGQPTPECPAGWRARGAPNEPARFLGWTAAEAYCRWAGGRLPTEEEWEKAARGRDGRVWPWGSEPDAKRFLGKATSNQRLVAVGSYPQGDSPYGVADLAGSLWEVTASPWEGGGHTMKGGSYLNELPYVRGSSRWASSDEDKGADYLGFRCVVDYEQCRLRPLKDAAGGDYQRCE